MSLKNRLENYLKKVWHTGRNIWVHKAQLETLSKRAGYLGDNGTRRLRELVNEGRIEKQKTGNSTKYRYIPLLEDIVNTKL